MTTHILPLLPALAICLLMLFSHSYLGVHILKRGIIFVDLALAQIAALGVSISFLFGADPHSTKSLVFGLSATVIAAFGFAVLRRLPDKVTREVTIGCVYVVSTALSIVILSNTTEGLDELESMFNGQILFASWHDVLVMAIPYLVLAVPHVFFRKKILALSFREEGEIRPSFMWEFFFFLTFAIVITLAVNVAGVLLVFAYLIIPAFSASFVSKVLKHKIVLAWVLGIFGTLGGLAGSFHFDWPTGPTVVSFMGLLPFVALLLGKIIPKERA